VHDVICHTRSNTPAKGAESRADQEAQPTPVSPT
jgi:hypothetical protein